MNKEQIYDEKINPLMAQIIALCQEHGIAMLANFRIPNEEDPGLQCTTALVDGDGNQCDDHKLALRILVPREALEAMRAKNG